MMGSVGWGGGGRVGAREGGERGRERERRGQSREREGGGDIWGRRGQRVEGGERERQTGRQTDRETDRDRDRETDRDRDTETQRQRRRQTDRQMYIYTINVPKGKNKKENEREKIVPSTHQLELPTKEEKQR